MKLQNKLSKELKEDLAYYKKLNEKFKDNEDINLKIIEKNIKDELVLDKLYQEYYENDDINLLNDFFDKEKYNPTINKGVDENDKK